MRPVSAAVLNTFREAYSHSKSALIPYRGGEESSDGILYRFQDEPQTRLLKILFLGSEDTQKAILRFESRLKFVEFLNQEGVRCIEPLLSLNDRLYERLEDQDGTWVAYSMKRVFGRTMSPKVWDPAFVQNWGRTIGGCHRAAQGYPEWEYCIDPVTSETYLTWESEWESFRHFCKEDDIKTQWDRIGKKLRSLPIQRDAFGFIHNDPHLWNLLVEGNKLTLIDFDVANHQWFINDIAIACQHVLFMLSGGLSQPVHNREYLINFLKEFLKGYYQENDLSRDWLNLLDLFFAYRRILLYTVMESWRKSKPGLQKSWREMIINCPPVLKKIEFIF